MKIAFAFFNFFIQLFFKLIFNGEWRRIAYFTF